MLQPLIINGIITIIKIKITVCAINKTENPFSLKDDEREMAIKTKPMFTRKLTNHHDNFGNPTKGL